MENKITVDTILDKLQEWVSEKHPIDASTWLDAAQKLTVLTGEEEAKAFEIDQKLAIEKVKYIEEGDSVAKASVKIQTLPDYVEMRKIYAKIARITELVRISKLQARMSSDSFHNN